MANIVRDGSCNRLNVCHGVLLLRPDVEDMAWHSSRFGNLDAEGEGGKEYSYRNRRFQRGGPDFDGLPTGTNQGHDVARWLQDKGIAAFVLKYRIMEKRQEGIVLRKNLVRLKPQPFRVDIHDVARLRSTAS